MAEWAGDVSDDQLDDEQRLIRNAVIRLNSKGGCKTEVAQEVLSDLVTKLKSL
jgi:hypothetical protein